MKDLGCGVLKIRNDTDTRTALHSLIHIFTQYHIDIGLQTETETETEWIFSWCWLLVRYLLSYVHLFPLHLLTK